MTSLIRFDPFYEVRGMRRAMDRMLNDVAGLPARAWPGDGIGSFPIDMYETEDAVIVKASLPGLKPEELDIAVQDEVLTIKGGTEREANVEKENYHRRELAHGAFSRSLALPVAVEHDKAEATFEDGILTVRLPKAEEVKPKTIKINARETVAA